VCTVKNRDSVLHSHRGASSIVQNTFGGNPSTSHSHSHQVASSTVGLLDSRSMLAYRPVCVAARMLGTQHVIDRADVSRIA
jgi:hypothetical protein